MPNPISLSKVYISLQQFNKIASGEYNAGEVRLAGENSLKKVNHHVHFSDFNKVTIPHEEVLAIKAAFVRALSNAKVDGNVLDAIRKQLGLAPAGPCDTSLLKRSITPLSRQQIRSIIDKTVKTIDGKQVATYDKLHEDFTASAKEYINVTRLYTNRTTAQNRSLDVSKDIALFQSVVAGDVDFHDIPDRKRLAEIMTGLKNQILDQAAGKPLSKDKNATITFTTGKVGGAGVNVTMQLGMSQEDFVDRLDDMLLRFDGLHTPDKEIRDARNMFRALNTTEERVAWLNSLGTTSADNLKVRTAIVSLLQDRGIGDWSRLSLANRVSDNDARALVAQLLMQPKDLRGDKLLQNSAIKYIADHAGDGSKVPKNERTFIPELGPAEFNKAAASVMESAKEGGDDIIPHRFKKVISDVRDEMRNRFGEYGVPAKQPLGSIASNWHDVLGSGPDAPMATPKSIRERLVGDAQNKAALNFANNYIKEMLGPGSKVAAKSLTIAGSLWERDKDLLGKLSNAQSLDAAKKILEGKRREIDEIVQLLTMCEKSRSGVVKTCRTLLAKELGISENTLARGEPNTMHVDTKAGRLTDKIIAGKDPAKTQEQIDAAYKKIAEDHVKAIVDGIKKVNASKLPQEVKDVFVDQLLHTDKPGKVNVDKIIEKAKLVDLTKVGDKLGANSKKEDGYKAVKELVELVAKLTRDIYDEMGSGGVIGAPEYMLMRSLILTVAGSREPEFAGKLQAFIERPDVIADRNRGDGDSPAASLGYIVPFFIHDPDEPQFVPIEAREKPSFPLYADFEPEGDAAVRALELGYAKNELALLRKTAVLYMDATKCSKDVAIAAALDHNSPARRLAAYGGRFTENAENFSKGLKLLDTFKQWFASTCSAVKDIEYYRNNKIPIPPNATSTGLNGSSAYLVKKAEFAYEKFLFEEIAINSNIALDPDNPDGVFSMEANPAMRFVGRGYTQSATNTLAQIPPERRQLLYQILDKLAPLLDTKDEKVRHDASFTADNVAIISRVMRHYDDFVKLRDSGDFTRESILAKLYPDVSDAAKLTNFEITQYNSNQIYYNIIPNQYKNDISHLGPILALINECGVTLGEALEAHKNNLKPPLAPYIASANGKIWELNNTFEGGLVNMHKDVIRPQNPDRVGGKAILSKENNAYKFVFPDKTTMTAAKGREDDKEVRAKNNAIYEKIAALCGKVHPAQINSVYFALSQAAMMQLNRAFVNDKIGTTEHTPVTFTFSRNEDTGAIKIHYSQPDGFPIKFHWDTVVRVDGTTTSTALVRD